MQYPLPANPCSWTYTTTGRIRQALGFEGSKIPASVHGVFKVDGWKVIIKRGVKSATGGRGSKTAKHRIFIDFGGREIPAGRLRQATCKVDHLRWKQQRTRRARWRAANP